MNPFAYGHVVRLDFSKMPPGYVMARGRLILPDGTESVSDDREAHTLAAAWAKYKARHDPPGMVTREWTGPDKAWLWAVAAAPERRGVAGSQPEARAAAWAWYERRLSLVRALEDVGLQLDLWPAALSWTEDNGDCEACESWLTRGPSWTADDFPTVLKAIARPCGPHCDCEAMGHDRKPR